MSRLCAIGFITTMLVARLGAAAEDVQFNRDIRPILSNNCFTCHGPDHNQRKAKLRLDVQEDALAKHDNGTPIVAGNTSGSELMQRIMSHDADEMMPPPKSGKKLTARQ